METRLASEIEFIVLHHTATSPDATWDEIDADHRARGWDGIGYHGLVWATGYRRAGRPLEAVGAHVLGYNRRSLGLALVGTFTDLEPGAAQLAATVDQTRTWWKLLGRKVPIVGHSDLAETLCPGRVPVYELWLSALRLEGIFK